MPFDPTGDALTVFQERYAQTPDETYEEACKRVAGAIATAESPDKRHQWEDRYYGVLRDGLFCPGGRVWYGAGRLVQQMLNCFVIPTGDSIGAWGRTISDLMQISARGGGVGINFSSIRGRGYSISNGGESTGSVSVMQMADRVGDILRGGGGRRTAMMHCLDITHPDIEEFISAKLNRNELTNANISVVIPSHMPTPELVNSIQLGSELSLDFNGIASGRSINAGEIWEVMVQNAWNSGEPGVLNQYLASRDNSMSYRYPLVSTNPCGEIWLPEYGCCCLGALVLPRFVTGTSVDWDSLDAAIRTSVRFLDSVLSTNNYPLVEVSTVSQGERRLGLGVMGLHSMLLDLGLDYDSDPGLKFVDELFNFIKATAYHASIDLAIEKGPFPFYNPEYINHGFARGLKQSIRRRIKEHGIRNCALLTVAPTGTTARVHEITSGIEPLFAPAFYAGRWVGDDWETVLNVTPEFRKHGALAKGAYDIPVESHFKMQVAVQKHIDNAVSKTINMPEDYPLDRLSDLWLDYLPYMKGSTFYRAGSRGQEPLTVVPLEDIPQNEGIEGSYYDECESGVCAL